MEAPRGAEVECRGWGLSGILRAVTRSPKPRIGRSGSLPKSVGFDRCLDGARSTAQTMGSHRG
jgi:hypothetical protein